MTDDPVCPQEAEGAAQRTAPDAIVETEQQASVSTAQAAQQLGVDGRTVRRYISEGRLAARQVRTQRGLEWQIYQTDLDDFKEERDRQAKEGQTSTQLTRSAEESQALSTTIQIISAELERRSVALTQAQETIERLANEAGQATGRSEVLEQQLAEMRQRVKELEEERDEWRHKAEQKPHRFRLLP